MQKTISARNYIRAPQALILDVAYFFEGCELGKTTPEKVAELVCCFVGAGCGNAEARE